MLDLTKNLNFVGNVDTTTGAPAGDCGFTESGDFVVSIGPDPSQKFFTSPSWQYISTGTTYDEKVATPHQCPNCGAYLKRNMRQCDYCLTEFW